MFKQIIIFVLLMVIPLTGCGQVNLTGSGKVMTLIRTDTQRYGNYKERLRWIFNLDPLIINQTIRRNQNDNRNEFRLQRLEHSPRR